jgi:hypothetical protein
MINHDDLYTWSSASFLFSKSPKMAKRLIFSMVRFKALKAKEQAERIYQKDEGKEHETRLSCPMSMGCRSRGRAPFRPMACRLCLLLYYGDQHTKASKGHKEPLKALYWHLRESSLHNCPKSVEVNDSDE